MMMTRFARFSPAAGLVALMAALVPASAQPQNETSRLVTETGGETGKGIYLRHCAVCHGLEGYGNGPLAAAMAIAPSDLTRVSAKHDGEFPSAKLADVIRNGGRVLGHGSTAMPAWGLYFAVKRKPEVARARINALVSYIESIQK